MNLEAMPQNDTSKSPESDLQRETALNPANLDTSVQQGIQETIGSPEIMKASLEYWAGINVLGGGPNPMLLAGKETSIEMANNNDPKVIEALKNEGIEVNADTNIVEMINNACQQRDTEEQKIRSLETGVISELGANRIRLHFDETMTHLSLIENLFDNDGNIKDSEKGSERCAGFMQLVEYVGSLEKNGAKVEITLGPGVPHPEREPEVSTEANPKKRYMYSITEYELPTDEADKIVWERYCKGIARYFPNADLTVWIEPNLDIFVQSGRDPEKYSETVVSAIDAIRTVNPEKKVGINMLFADQSFAVDTLNHIKTLGLEPKDVVGYVTFNPYRFRAPERPTWTEGSRRRVFKDMPTDELATVDYDTYEEEILRFHRRLSEYGINDIRVGESGYEGDNGLKGKDRYEYSPHQNAVCNIRSWVLDRYLWIRETPWRAIQKEGSKSHRGLVAEDGTPTENFHAYKHFNEIFTPDVEPVGELTDPEDRRVYCKIFKNKQSGEDIAVLWVAQKYGPSEEPYQRSFVINTPESASYTRIAKLWSENTDKDTVSGEMLSSEGIAVAEDPVILVGNFGFEKH